MSARPLSQPAAKAPPPDLITPAQIAERRRESDVKNLLARRYGLQQERRFAAEPVLLTGWGEI